MRNHVNHVCAALAIAAMGAACSGRTGQVADRHDQAGSARGANQRVLLRGCVQPAAEGPGFTLQHVMVLPLDEQPTGQDTIDNPLIARGSWVRLAGTDDFQKYVNNEVAVTGDIVETGANTVGTAGRDGSTPT